MHAILVALECAKLYFDSNHHHHHICMSRYMTAMATRFFPRMALAAIGPRPGWRRPPKTRSEKLGTFRSYLTLLHFSETLDRENHVLTGPSAITPGFRPQLEIYVFRVYYRYGRSSTVPVRVKYW